MKIPTQWDYGAVSASVLVATWASWTALTLSRRRKMLGLAAVCLGSGIWAMHFIGMLAYRVPVHVVWDATWTAISLVLPIGGALVGFRLLAEGSRPALVGFIFGASIVGMHYTGMIAMHPMAVKHWSLPIVFASFLVAWAAAAGAAWIVERGVFHWWKVAASLAMGVAISGMHYTGMLALTLTDGMPYETVVDGSRTLLIIAVFSVSALIFTACLAVALRRE